MFDVRGEMLDARGEMLDVRTVLTSSFDGANGSRFSVKFCQIARVPPYVF